MKEKLKRFFTIDIKKNFIKYKLGYGVAIGVVFACIWCIIGIYVAPYIVKSIKSTGAKDIAQAEVSALQENQLYKFDISSFSSDNKIAYLNGTKAVGGSTINLTNLDFTDYSNWYIKQGNNIYNITSMKGRRATDVVGFNFIFASYYFFNFQGGSSYTEALRYYNNSGITIAFPSTEDIYLHIGSLSRNSSATSDSKNITNNFKSNIIRYLTLVQTDYNITYNITNGSASPNTLSTSGGTIQITPDTGYTYPGTISYTGTASAVEYYEETGEIVITNPTSDFTITAECLSDVITIEVGYYLIYPPEIPSTADTIELSFHTISLLSSTIGNSEPLTPVISSTTYNYLDRQTGLTSGLFALTSLQDTEPRELWRDYENNKQLNGAIIIYVPSQTTIERQHALINCLLPITYNEYDALRYWGYGIAVSPNTKAYDLGYADGYDSGVNTQIIGQTTSGIISQIFSGLFGNVLSVEIFPGFPLYIFILIPVVFAVVGLLLWLIRGK